MCDFDMALIASDEDVILIKNPYCKKCANMKLDILKIYSITNDDLKDIIKSGSIKKYNVKCECIK